MVDEPSAGPVPPYVSWATVVNKITQMERDGVPARIDGSYLVGMAGGTQNQFKQALRSLGLIDESDRVTPTLVDLVNRPDDRPVLMGNLLRERYASLTDLGANTTHGQLDEVLAAYRLGPETRRKAASFYLAAAKFAGIPLSPHLRAGRVTGSRRAAGVRARRVPPRQMPNVPEVTSSSSSTASTGSTGSDVATHTLTLASGGTVTIAVIVNIFEMSRSDRDFVLGLVDALRDYPSDSAGDPKSDPGGA